MTCPNCRCPTCRAAALNAVLAKHVARETDYGVGPAMIRDLPLIEQHNAATLQTIRAKDEWRDVDMGRADA